MTAGTPPRVVILGAGFGGLWAAKRLAGQPVEVTIVDRNNFHTFYPLLYQVSAAGLGAAETVYPVRKIFRGSANVHFRMGEARGVDLEARRLETDRASIPYDYLVLAPGSATSFLGVPGAAEHGFPLKELGDAIALRNTVMSSFEAAVQEPDPRRVERLLSFVIAGGGATGVEFAGALAELARGTLWRDYAELRGEHVRIHLVEARPGLLPGLPEDLGAYAEKRLRGMGIRVHTDTRIVRVEPDGVELSDGERLDAETTVWTAGVRGDGPSEAPGLPLSPEGWIRTGGDLRVEGCPGVYALGDVALVAGARLPLVAPAATQGGDCVARNILREIAGEPTRAFEYHDKGILGTIGRNSAYSHVYGRSITGPLAWLIWLVIHIQRLVGFRNRLVVLLNWTVDYFVFDRPVRLISPRGPRGIRGDEKIRDRGSSLPHHRST